MKKIWIMLSLGLLCGCSSPEQKQVNTILNYSRPRTITVLQDKTEDQVVSLLGKPTFVRVEGENQSWLYKAPDCALFVFFNGDGLSSYTESKGSCDKSVAQQMMADKKKTL